MSSAWPAAVDREHGNFVWLLLSLLGFLLGSALLWEFPAVAGEGLLLILFEASLVFGVWSIGETRRHLRLGLALVVGGAVGVVVFWLTGAGWARLVAMFCALLFYLLTTWLAFRLLFADDRVDLNKLYGSICIYLLVGISWAILFFFLVLLNPDAFRGLDANPQVATFSELLYYSYVTISTLGYGDVTPVSPLARTLAFLEALFGQFYIAILVASFVGMHISRRDR